MRMNVEKLTLVGFGIVVMSFLILSDAKGQTNQGSRLPKKIQSTEDYVKAEELMESLASEMYKINQMYPGFTYQHKYEGNNLVSVTVNGIADKAMTKKVAQYLMDIEKLGIALQEADIYHPGGQPKKSEMLNENQVKEYTP